MEVIRNIIELFDQYGDLYYALEKVTQKEHALQTAKFAEDEAAGSELIVAALLHDIGHFLYVENKTDRRSSSLGEYMHEVNGYRWLLKHFGIPIAEPVRLHVPAKRYLCTIDPDYIDHLSTTSRNTLDLQGGLMSRREVVNFEQNPYYYEATRLRKWDDMAKIQKMNTPSLYHFIPHLEECLLYD